MVLGYKSLIYKYIEALGTLTHLLLNCNLYLKLK